jgi:hypothetical protein
MEGAVMRCEYCREPLDPDARSHARFCCPAHRAAAHRAKRVERERRLMAEAVERAEQLDYARGFLRRQTAAIIACDQDALDALVAEAEAHFAAIGAL